MKSIRIIILTALSLVTMQSFAQTPIDALRQKLTSAPVSVELEYELTVPNALVTGSSAILLQGDMYHLHGDGLDVYNDGNSVWTVDESSREVVIESAADVAEDYRGNPVLLLSRMDDFFKVESQKTVNSRRVYVLRATVECGISQASLELSSDGALLSGEFSLDDGNVFSFNVLSMKKAEESHASSFSPQRKFGSDWIVTDLR